MSNLLFLLVLLSQPISGWLLRKHLPKSGKILNVLGGLALLPLVWFSALNTDRGLGGLVMGMYLMPLVLLMLSVLIGNGAVVILIKMHKQPSYVSYLLAFLVLVMGTFSMLSLLFQQR